MRKYIAFAAITALLAIPAISSAYTVALTNSDASGTSSFNGAGMWDDGAAPASGNDYVVSGSIRLRTPADGIDYTFAGDSLTLTNNGAANSEFGLSYKGTGIITVPNLILETGGQVNQIFGAGTCTLDGAITVAGDCNIYSKHGPLKINSDMSGSATITIPAGPDVVAEVIWASSNNTYIGSIDVNEKFTQVAGSFLNFAIGANGVNNSISGSNPDTTFDGTFEFDLSGASTTIGDSWTIVTAGTATYSTNFSVSGFTDNGDGTWFLDGASKYKYYEDTGVLEVVSANVIPITAQDMTPAEGTTVFQPQPVISITLVDGSSDVVETGSIAMTVGGSSVTPSVTSPGGGTHVVSYTPPSALSGLTSVQVTFDDDSANGYTNSWTFTVHPSTTDKLWNINIAGNRSATARPVTDGVIAVAPSAGANLWNNLTGISGSLNTFDVTDSNGGNSIGYETSGSHNWGESVDNGMTVEMFQGWTGANAPMNMTNVLSGLNTANAYDIYVYSTWRWTQNRVNYQIIEGYADVTAASITEVQANVQNAVSNDYTGCVYGENYIIFTNVTPTAAGRISFTGVCSDGVLSGLQILEVPGGANIPELDVVGSVPADGYRFSASTPTLTAYFVNVAETVNSGSIAMTVDGVAVPASYSYNNPTSAVSYTVSSPFEPGSTHTARVVVASSPSGALYTNEWSFTVVPAPSSIVYVDTDTTNTLAWNGETFSSWAPVVGSSAGTHTGWGTRTFGNGGLVYQSPFTTDAPRLKTTVSGLPSATYAVYVYMWVQGNDWRIETALTNNLSGDLPLYKKSDYPANTKLSVPWAEYASNTWGSFASAVPSPYYSSNLVVNPFASGTVMVAESDRRLMAVYVGRISGTEFTVYVDDDASEGSERTWYDGVGYEEVTGGPTLAPNILSFSVSGGSATLSWTSESVGTYSIMRKTSLSSANWTAVKTGISGGDPNTTDSVSVSGADQEFYRIEGE